MTAGQLSIGGHGPVQPPAASPAVSCTTGPVAPNGVAVARSARFRIGISRDQGTVVIGVHGDLDGPGARHLRSVLDDIIDGQGNMAVVVDLHDVCITEPSGLSVFAAAAKRASTSA